MTLKPLSGIRVLDFTAFPPGGACTVMLAETTAPPTVGQDTADVLASAGFCGKEIEGYVNAGLV